MDHSIKARNAHTQELVTILDFIFPPARFYQDGTLDRAAALLAVVALKNGTITTIYPENLRYEPDHV